VLRPVALQQEAAALDHHDRMGLVEVLEATFEVGLKALAVHRTGKFALRPVRRWPGYAGGLGRKRG
jgi:hypothetical protein